MNIVYDVLSVDGEVVVGRGSKGGVEDRAIFGRVDVAAAEHVPDLVFETGGARKRKESIQNLVVDQMLGEVHREVPGLEREAVDTFGVGFELRPQVDPVIEGEPLEPSPHRRGPDRVEIRVRRHTRNAIEPRSGSRIRPFARV